MSSEAGSDEWLFGSSLYYRSVRLLALLRPSIFFCGVFSVSDKPLEQSIRNFFIIPFVSIVVIQALPGILHEIGGGEGELAF